jgi:lysine 2,3-aminomutase
VNTVNPPQTPNTVNTLSKPTIVHDKLTAAAPEVRRQKPPAPASALRHRVLKGGLFWQAIPAYQDITEEEFCDFQWQMKHSVNNFGKLIGLLKGHAPDAFIADAEAGFHRAPMAVRVTPYLLSLIDWSDPYNDPIRTQFIPIASRLSDDHPMLTLDSLHEQLDAPVPGLTHRYPDKALFLVLDTCPVYCRFCTRSYAIGTDTDTVEKVKLKVDPKRWEQAFTYIASRPELEDIVISGGDAFNLAPKHISTIGTRLLEMPNIRRIRFATKGPAVMPMKLLSDHEWLDAFSAVHALGLRLHKEVVMHTHFNCPSEITDITRRSMNVLSERGITVRNQSVLQRGVNDSIESMSLLIKRLGEVNVHPYYVYQHDMVKGVEDLRTSVQTTLDIAKAVRGTTAGFNTPTFVVDAPGGGGKRDVFSYEHYDRETGVSVYRSPAVDPHAFYLYFDPLHSLSPEVQARWQDPVARQEMVQAAVDTATATGGRR